MVYTYLQKNSRINVNKEENRERQKGKGIGEKGLEWLIVDFRAFFILNSFSLIVLGFDFRLAVGIFLGRICKILILLDFTFIS